MRPRSLDRATTPFQCACSRPAPCGTASASALQARLQDSERMTAARRRPRARQRGGPARRGASSPIGGPKPRQILAMLVAAHGGVVSTDRLAGGAVGRRPAGRPRRGAAEQHLPPAQGAATRTPASSPGRPGTRWRSIRRPSTRGGSRRTSSRARADVAPAAVIESNERALACFSGPPYAEFADREWARADVLRLEEMRTVAREEVLSARLALGEDRTIVADLEALVSEHPLRERPWHELAVALAPQRAIAPMRSAASPRSAPSCATSWASIRRPRSGELEARILESDPALLGSHRRRSPAVASRRLPAEATPLVGPQRRPRRHRAPPRRSIGSSRWSGPAGSARPAWRCGSRPTCGTTAAARCTWSSWRRCTTRSRPSPRSRPPSTCSSASTSASRRRSSSTCAAGSALLVLDNCEHLRVAVAHLAERMLAACPDLTVLATSREVLGLPGEHVRRVEPLAVATSSMPIDELAKVPAIRMFVERAAASNPAFALDADNAAAVAEIVRRVDGLPLAIELAAARSSAISPAALAERLRERFDLLDHAQAGRSERHQTLTELVAWSFNLLNGARADPVRSGVGVRRLVRPRRGGDDLHRRVARRVVGGTGARRPRRQVDGAAGRRRRRPLPGARAAARVRPGRAARIRTGRRRRAPLGLVPRPRRAVRRVDGRPRRARRRRPGSTASSATSAPRSRTSPNSGDVERCARLVAALREYSFRSMRAEVIAWADEVIAMPGFDDSPRAPLVLADRGLRAVRPRRPRPARSSTASGRSPRRNVSASSSSGLAERVARQLVVLPRRSRGRPAVDRSDARRRPHRLAGPARPTRSTCDRWPPRASAIRDAARDVRRRGARRRPPVRVADGPGPGAVRARVCRSKASDPTAAAEHLQRAAEVAAGAGNRWVQAFALTEVLWLRSPPRVVAARRWPGSPTSSTCGSAVATGRTSGCRCATCSASSCSCDDNVAAATLHGALTAIGAAYALPFEASDAERIDALVDELRDEMRPAEFAAAVRRGASMTDGEIVEFVQERIRVLTT